MNTKQHFIVVACLCGAATLPALAAASTGDHANTTTDDYIVQLSSAAEDAAEYCGHPCDDFAVNDSGRFGRQYGDQLYDTRANLIKARYFIKIAEIDDDDLHNSGQARLDLQRARYYLVLARNKANAAEQAQIQQVVDALQLNNSDLMQACGNRVRQEQRQGFDQLAAQLDDLANNI
jgi:hypothetical protein